MNIKHLSFSFTFILLFLSINALPQHGNDAPDNSSMIYIYRPYAFRASAVGINIKLNEQPIGKITSGLKINYKIFSEGRISILGVGELNGQTGSPVQEFIEIESGKTYYVRIDLTVKSIDDVIQVVSEEVAKKEWAVPKAIYSTIELTENIERPIASLSNKNRLSPKAGTGFLINSEGYIVTNHHVVSDATKIIVRGINGNLTNEYLAKVVCLDKNNDLALIKIEGIKFDSIPYIFSPVSLKTGEDIYTMGYPLTTELGEEIKLTNGVISSTTGYQNDITAYQISAPVQPGNSGGPLLDKNGNLIGIINAKYRGAENVSYAIKVNYLKTLLDLSPESIILPSKNIIKGKSLPEQVAILKNFIFIVEVNKK